MEQRQQVQVDEPVRDRLGGDHHDHLHPADDARPACPGNKDFTGASVNYAPLVTGGVILAVGIWWLVEREADVHRPQAHDRRDRRRDRRVVSRRLPPMAMLDDPGGPRAGDRAGAGDGAARRRRGRSTRRSPAPRPRFPAWRARRARRPRAAAAAARRRAGRRATRSSRVLEARNAGKPIGDARGEIGDGRRRRSATTPARPSGCSATRSRSPAAMAMTFREPLGVVGLIVPVELPARRSPPGSSAPALAAGNTVVLKPAELTPLTALRFAELALEAGLPEGVVNVVVGPGVDVRRAARRAPRRREDRVHRLDRGRARDRRRRRADDQARDARAGRQVAPTSSSPTPTSRRPPRPRRGRCSATPARTAARARGSSSSAARCDEFMDALERGGRGDPRRRPARRGDADGPADLGRRSATASRRSSTTATRRRDPRQRARRARLLVRADGAVPGRRRRGRAATRGDLRAGRRASSRSTTRPRRSRSPTTRSTGCRARSGRATAAARCASRARIESRRPVDQLEHARCA